VASTALAVLVCSSLEFFTVNRKTRHCTHTYTHRVAFCTPGQQYRTQLFRQIRS
jgi:hypothetical protein